MKLLCETRWVERHSTMHELKTIYPYVIKSLEAISVPNWDTKSITDASGLLRYLQSPQLVASFVISEHMLSYTKQLSKKL